MSMSTGGGGSSLTNEPNVTPMIDVLLVLLVIFMMIIPMSRKAIDTQLPDPTPQPASNVVPDQIVLVCCPTTSTRSTRNLSKRRHSLPVSRPSTIRVRKR